ncbi:hypothetical protein C8N32_104167 [Rhodovulum imhoffii]|uniref:Uncharacterized protein n=1 Tax=Rhodovulum imhoffii TaxID=365340 RepID=A0A2T5BUD7_9RHOB|nr:hypothetical protein [Rhodovulum imhoffii]MBK5934527.1 hypothetical protein [Rhodovulum imhoffii]PTN03056.1 hypothetical protein C8N32_104167 [Rhodovulum imhoffii]
MNRTEFILVTTAILFVTFLLGWAASWLFHRVSRVTKADMGELDKMAQAVHEAEEERDQAVAYLHQMEADLKNRLHQAEAEARAAMEGLRNARAEIEQLRG